MWASIQASHMQVMRQQVLRLQHNSATWFHTGTYARPPAHLSVYVSGSTLWPSTRLCFTGCWHKLVHRISDRLCADSACIFQNVARHVPCSLRLVSIAAGSKMHPACRSSIPGKFDATLRDFVWFAVCSICVDLNPWRGSTAQLLGTLVQAAGKAEPAVQFFADA
jgi:hypothetical protein